MSAASDGPPDVPSLDERIHELRVIDGGGEEAPDFSSRSLSTAKAILERDERGVLGGKVLGYDEMAQTETLGGDPVDDACVARIRLAVEESFGEWTKAGKRKPLRLSTQDLRDAVAVLARRNPYHPVRRYLRSLEWDRVERLAHLPEVLNCEASTLNLQLLRRWFVSAVARPSSPGCKVDTVLILHGRQGTWKSSFFRVLSEPWFVDSAMDVRNKDAYMTLQGAWLLEWPELDSMTRRDAPAIKAFITSPTDAYRRPYDRYTVKVPRGCVIVGTTNQAEFLNDDTGARRFWPIHVSGVDLVALAAQRDQLWAEAVAAYDAGEKWYLVDGEGDGLSSVHESFSVSDPWASRVLGWAEDRVPFQLVEVLEGPLNKAPGQITMGDQKRVAAILRAAGFVDEKRHGRKHWLKKETP